MGDYLTSRIRIHLRNADRWRRFDNIYIRGNAYLDGVFITLEAIPQIFKEIKTFEEFMTIIKKLNGSFAIIYEKNDGLLLAVDRIRSIPIFYSLSDENAYISDDPHWILGQIGEKFIDDISALEFLLTGYVTGKDTLYPNIKQLQSGEAIHIACLHKDLRISFTRYYRYIPCNYLNLKRVELLENLDNALLRVFDRLIKRAKGRTIVVPLSGGYDSRLIVLMLKRLGYKNVITFSYGVPGNRESEISEEVAKILGVTWEFVPYSNEAWRKWYYSDELKAYYKFGDGLCVLPHEQDWPAVWELKRLRLIPEDSIFVPGHAADFVSGSHIPKSFLGKGHINFNKIFYIIYNDNYNLWSMGQNNDFISKFKDKLKSQIGDEFDYNDESACSIYECWDWQERQAKFIANSVRVYEFWGYDWWLPFWDSEFMDFWSRIPLNERVNQRLYISYVDSLFERITGCYVETDRKKESFVNKLIKSLIAELKRSRFFEVAKPFYKFAKNNYIYVKRLEKYNNDPFAMTGIVSKEDYERQYTGTGFNSFFVYFILRDLEYSGRCSDDFRIILNTIVNPPRKFKWIMD